MRTDALFLVFLFLTPLFAGCLATDEKVQSIQQQDPIVSEDMTEQEDMFVPAEKMEFELNFTFSGWVEVACDITNELFHQPIETSYYLIVKFLMFLF